MTRGKFLGTGRRRVVAEIVQQFDLVDAGTAGPTWIALEAPSGWGKTRIVQEVYRSLAARDLASTGRYWPVDITSDSTADDLSHQTLIDRKIVAPALVERAAHSLPAFFWWGISAHERNGMPSVALAQDLRQFQGHLPYLMARCKQLKRARERATGNLREIGDIALDEVRQELTSAVLDLAGLGLPGVGFVWRIGAWTTGKVRDASKERKLIAASSSIHTDHTGVIDDAYETIRTLARPGLPVVIAVEDVHVADATLLTLLARLMSSGRPVLILSTAWPAAMDTIPGLKSVASAIVDTEAADEHGPRLVRLSADAPAPAGWARDAVLSPLGDESLARIVRAQLPGATPATVRLLVSQMGNPLQLELACALPSVRRRTDAAGVLELSTEDVLALPPALDDMYQQMWEQLPHGAREAIALTLCGIPALMDRETSDERWDTAMLRDVARNVFPDAVDLVAAVDSAPTSYAWAQRVEDTLCSFIDQANLRVAARRRSEYFSDADVDRIRRELLHAVAASLRDVDLADSVRQHRAGLILALSAEGFAVAHDDLAEASEVRIELLSAHDDESGNVLGLLDGLSPKIPPPAPAGPRAGRERGEVDVPASLDAPEPPATTGLAVLSIPLQRQRAFALARVGRFEESESAWRALIADLRDDHRDSFEARVELASVVLSKPARVRDEETGLLGLQNAIRSRFGQQDPLWVRVARLEAEEDYRQMQWHPTFLRSVRAEDLSQTIRDFGAADPDVIALHRVTAAHGHALGYTGAALGVLGALVAALSESVGHDHPEVLRLRSDVGLYLYEQGFYAGAASELESVLELQDDTVGPEHVDCCRTLGYLARAEVRDGRFVSAFGRVEERLALVRGSSGDRGEQTLRLTVIRDELAILASAQAGDTGLLPTAVRSLRAAIPRLETQDGAASSGIAQVHSEIARGLALLDDHAGALTHAQESAWLLGHARNAPGTWRAMIDLALCHERLADPTSALTVYAELLLMLEETSRSLDTDEADLDIVARPAAFVQERWRAIERTGNSLAYPRSYYDPSAPDGETASTWVEDSGHVPDDTELLTLRQHHHGRRLVFGPAERDVRVMHYALAVFRLNRGELEHAVALAQEALDIADLPAYARSRYERDIDVFERACALDVLERALADLGRPLEAVEHISRALGLVTAPADRVQLLMHRIRILNAGELFEDALRDIEQAESLAETSDETRAIEREKRVALVRIGRLAEALIPLDHAVANAPTAEDLREALTDRAQTYTLAGAHEHAVHDLEAVIAISPDDAWAHSRIALELTELERHDEAGVHFTAAVRGARSLGASFTELFVRAVVVQMVLEIGYSDDAFQIIDEAIGLIDSSDELGGLKRSAREMFDPLRVSALELRATEEN